MSIEKYYFEMVGDTYEFEAVRSKDGLFIKLDDIKHLIKTRTSKHAHIRANHVTHYTMEGECTLCMIEQDIIKELEEILKQLPDNNKKGVPKATTHGNK